MKDVSADCARCSIEEGDHNGEGKQLNFIQHDVRLLLLLYSTYSAGSVTLRLTISAKAPLLTVLSAKSSSGEGDHSLALSNTKNAVVLLQHVHSCCVALFSLSATAPADLSCLSVLSGSANQFSYELGQPASKPAASFEAGQVVNRAIT